MVGKSMDFSSALVLLAGTMLIWLFDDKLVGGMETAMIESFRAIGTYERIPEDLLPIAREAFIGFLVLLMPMVGGIVTSFLLELLVYPAIYAFWRERELGPEAGSEFAGGGRSTTSILELGTIKNRAAVPVSSTE